MVLSDTAIGEPCRLRLLLNPVSDLASRCPLSSLDPEGSEKRIGSLEAEILHRKSSKGSPAKDVEPGPLVGAKQPPVPPEIPDWSRAPVQQDPSSIPATQDSGPDGIGRAFAWLAENWFYTVAAVFLALSGIFTTQYAADLLLTIKGLVDDDKTPGRFLHSGTANLSTIPKVAESLAGRMEVIRLLPLSQAEIIERKSGFIDRAFARKRPTADRMIVGDDLVENVLSGGYPKALAQIRRSRKQDWYRSYLDAVVQRDVRDVARIEQFAVLPKLISMLANCSGQLINYSAIAADLDINHVTTKKYVVCLRVSTSFIPCIRGTQTV